MKHIKNHISLAVILIGMAMWSCKSDEMEDSESMASEVIYFDGFASDEASVNTRANTNTTAITATRYPNTYFHMYIEGQDLNNTPQTGLSTYTIPSGYSNTIIPVEGRQPLNWFARNTDHYFWSWTVPWDQETPATTEPFTFEFKNTYITETTNSSASSWASGSWQNGSSLERCVGAFRGPDKYVVTGQYVPLKYRHLVSKIFLGAFSVVDNATATAVTGVKGNLIIYGLPTSATYYPVNRNADGTPSRPYISMPENWDYPKSESVTFAITNYGRTYYTDSGSYIYNAFTSSSSSTLYDCWYICPEVDFSKLSFKIEIYEYNSTLKEWVLSPRYGNNGAYYGDFKGIKFSRSTNGSNYDDYPNNGTDDTILHAGEYIQLSINLNMKGNPTIKTSVASWGSQSRNAKQHVKPGEYSVPELTEMSSVMNSKNEDLMREYYEIYGSGQNTDDDPTDPDYGKDLDIIKIYDDIGYSGSGTSTSGSNAKMGSTLYVADGYILDGMGHTINTSYTSLTIGNVRDVYFRYYYSYTSNGVTITNEYIVYIDPYGNVKLVDPVTYQETDTGYNLNNFTKNPVTLDLKTGKVS